MTTFPIHTLPKMMRDAVMGAHNNTNIPVECVSLVALCVAALSIQGHYDVRPLWRLTDDGASVPTSLFGIVINRSGGGKTTAFNEFMGGHKRAVAEAEPDFNEALSRYIHAHAQWEQEVKEIKGDRTLTSTEKVNKLVKHDRLKPILPPNPDSILKTITTAALYSQLEKSSPSAGIFTSEGSEFFKSHSMVGNKGAEVELSGVMSLLWENSALRKDTVSGGTVKLKDRRLSACLMVQSPVINEFLSNNAVKGQGIHARCLMVNVPSFTKPELAMGAAALAKQAANRALVKAFTDFTYRLSAKPLPVNPDDPYRLEPEVLEWEDTDTTNPAWSWFNDEVRFRGERFEGQGTEGFINRTLEQMMRIAGVLAVMAGEAKISNETVKKAIELADYFHRQWDSLDNDHVDAKDEEDRIIMTRLETDFFKAHKALGKASFTRREITHGEALSPKPPSKMRKIKTSKVDLIIEAMVAEGTISASQAKGANNASITVYNYLG